MRKILFFLLLISSVASGQVKQIYNQYGGVWKRFQIDSAIKLPMLPIGVKDNGNGLDTAQVYYSKADSSLKIYTGSQWISVGAGGSMVYPGAGIALSTGSAWGSSIASSTATQLLRRNAANTGYEFFTPTYILPADTATMLSGYTRLTRFLDSLTAHWAAIQLRATQSALVDTAAAIRGDLVQYNVYADGGADTTGNSDVSSIVQSAINGGYRNIYFPPGKYKFTSSVNMKDSVMIHGEGIASRIIFTMDGAAFSLTDGGGHAAGSYNPSGSNRGDQYWRDGTGGGYKCVIKNLSFIGNRTGTNQSAIKADYVNGCTFSDLYGNDLGGYLVHIKNNGFNWGNYTWTGMKGNTVSNSYADACYGGVLLDSTAEYNTVTGNSFHYNVYGVFDFGGNNNVSENNLSANQYGFRIAGYGNDGHGVATSNVINHCNYSLYVTDLPRGYYFSNNLIFADDSIVFRNTSNIYITGGFLYASSGKTIFDNCTNTVLSNIGKLFVGETVYTVVGEKPASCTIISS